MSPSALQLRWPSQWMLPSRLRLQWRSPLTSQSELLWPLPSASQWMSPSPLTWLSRLTLQWQLMLPSAWKSRRASAKLLQCAWRWRSRFGSATRSQLVSESRKPGYDAIVGDVRELLLHRVRHTVPADDASLLGVADIADLAVVLVVPGKRRREDGRQSDFAVSDCLDHLVRGDR